MSCSSSVLANSSFYYYSILAQLEGLYVVMIWVHSEAHQHLGWLAFVSGLCDFQLNPLQLFKSWETLQGSYSWSIRPPDDKKKKVKRPQQHQLGQRLVIMQLGSKTWAPLAKVIRGSLLLQSFSWLLALVCPGWSGTECLHSPCINVWNSVRCYRVNGKWDQTNTALIVSQNLPCLPSIWLLISTICNGAGMAWWIYFYLLQSIYCLYCAFVFYCTSMGSHKLHQTNSSLFLKHF